MYHLLSTQVAVILLITILQTSNASSQYQYKHLAGPAAEFPSFTPPGLTSGMHSRYYVLPLATLEYSGQKWTHNFPVDHCDIFGITMFAYNPESFTLKFLSPSGHEVSANGVYDENVGYGEVDLQPCRTFLFEKPVPSVGTWSIIVTVNSSTSFPVAAMFFASFYPSDLILQAFVPAENLIVGQYINIMTLLPTTVGSEMTSNLTRHVTAFEEATTMIYLPDGSEETLKLREGLSRTMMNINKRDTNAADFYGSFKATSAGTYRILVQVDGQLSDGTNFIRSLWYAFTVVHPSIEITGRVEGSLYTHKVSKRVKIRFNIGVNWDGSDSPYRAFAQVWATREDYGEVPVAWISGLVEVQSRDACLTRCQYIEMELDIYWLELANAKHPLTLKSVTLDETKTYITLSKSDAVEVIAEDELMNWSPSLKAEDIEIDWEMKEGYNPYRVKKEDNTNEFGQLLLLHGYCAGYNGFLLPYFDNDLLYTDYGQNRFINEYAESVIDFLADNDSTRFSVVGHSQGGMVALHLYTYYHTGLDVVVSVAILCSYVYIATVAITGNFIYENFKFFKNID